MKKWWMCWEEKDDHLGCRILFKFGTIPLIHSNQGKTVELSPRKWIGWGKYYRAELDETIVVIPANDPNYLKIKSARREPIRQKEV